MSNAPAGNGTQLTLRQRLNDPAVIAELGRSMPQHCKPDRMARIALTALTRTPKLANCTPASFFECLLSLSQWGLEPDGRRAHLIPYGDKCTLVIDYKGYVELAYRSGIVLNIHADLVREGDDFEYSLGKIIRHTPWFLRRDQGPDEAGDVFAVYCTVELTGGTTKSEVLSKGEIEAIRKRSKAGNNGPWVSDWGEMAKKTAFRRVSKWLPLSAEIRDAFDKDQDAIDSTSTPSQTQTVSDLTAILNAQQGGEVFDQHPEDNGSQVDPLEGISEKFLSAETRADAKRILDDLTGPDAVVDLDDAQRVLVNGWYEDACKRIDPPKKAKQPALAGTT